MFSQTWKTKPSGMLTMEGKTRPWFIMFGLQMFGMLCRHHQEVGGCNILVSAWD